MSGQSPGPAAVASSTPRLLNDDDGDTWIERLWLWKREAAGREYAAIAEAGPG